MSSVAKSDEPLKPSEPVLMTEPGEVTNVVDAFDSKFQNPFDIHISLGFQQTWSSGKIRRESNIGPNAQPNDSGFTHNIENIAKFKHTVSTLNIRTDVGLFHDLGVFFRLPIIVADDRSLSDLDGTQNTVNRFDGRAADPATGLPLFRLPFTSPTRSGIDFISVGLRWSPFNQVRDPSKPTLTLELEGRFGVGEPLRACNANPETVPAGANPASATQRYAQCPTNSVVSDGRTWYRNPADKGQDPGISRGTNAVRFGFIASNRFGYVEPYGGFWFMAEFQKRGTALGDFSGLEGIVTNRPPLQGGINAGLMIHPWENREKFQRFTVDFRFLGKYLSQGRDYTPLFDALGSSTAASLIAPNPASYKAGPVDSNGRPTSVGDYSKTVAFSGVTDVEAHGEIGGLMNLNLQVGRYIRFTAGFGFNYVQSHLISSSDACNPDFKPDSNTGKQGRCQIGTVTTGPISVTGVPNPNHRPSIDLPGRRFRVTDSFTWDTWLSGTLMF